MRYALAILPLVVVLILMIRWKWGAHLAGPAAWVAGVILAALWFGLTPQLFWVSQAKGLLLSLFVLAVMWPALFLFHWLQQNGGVAAAAHALETAIPTRGMCLLLLSWAVSGVLEGLAGFGLPIAVVAPMLVALEVPPLTAVAAVAVGHCWAVTFGDMGVILQTLAAVTGIEAARLIPWAALLLGADCLLCGLTSAYILKQLSQWPKVVGLAGVMGSVQYLLAAAGLAPLSAFGAGLSGILAYLMCSRFLSKPKKQPSRQPLASGDLFDMGSQAENGEAMGALATLALAEPMVANSPVHARRRANVVFGTYGAVALLMAVVTLVGPLRAWTRNIGWQAHFPEVTSRTGAHTPAATGQALRPLSHPGMLILVVALGAIFFRHRPGEDAMSAVKQAGAATIRSAGAASVGILSMVGLSTLMDHSGMTLLLAQGASGLLGPAYPLLAPWVGTLGAFATGSNNNSNVLFGSLQKNAALLLGLNPDLLIAAQSAGGSLGSMLAPAKIVVGCSTVDRVGQEGQVLRRTVPLGLGLGLATGMLVLLLSRLSAAGSH